VAGMQRMHGRGRCLGPVRAAERRETLRHPFVAACRGHRGQRDPAETHPGVPRPVQRI